MTTASVFQSSTVDVVIRRLDGVRGRPPKCRATCPACARKGALSVGEGRDGQTLLRCFAGCEIDAIANAVGFAVRDLFATTAHDRERERFGARRRFTTAPQATVREALTRELDRLRTRLRAELGYDRPIRSSDINTVRERVSRIFELELAPVPAFAWECPPHDDDPAWPCLFERALEEEVRRRWHALNVDARGWETDPHGAGFYDRLRAERLARKWQRSLAS